MIDINEFRQKLEKAVRGFPKKHIGRIDKLKDCYPHNISLHSNPNCFDKDDCFLYVFKNILPKELDQIFSDLVTKKNRHFEDVCLDLISEGFLPLNDEQRESDIIVVYFAGNVPKHFGRIEGNRIISKWSNKGYAWKHRLFEVPLSYGDTVKFSNGKIDQNVFRRVIGAHSERKY